MVTRAALIGASGRMGAAIVRANLADGALTIVAAIGSPGGKSAGRDLGGLIRVHLQQGCHRRL